MAERTPTQRLDDFVEAVLKNPETSVPADDPRLAPLLRVAAYLLDLPGDDFRARLREDLSDAAERMKGEEEIVPAAAAGAGVRPGFHTVTPYLQVRRAEALLEFLKEGLGATETFRTKPPGGGMHAEARLGDSMLMIGGSEAMSFPEYPTALHLYVPDADATYASALEAGAKSLYAPVDQFYGDREAGIEDPAGNHWYVATHRLAGKDRHQPEGLHSVTLFFHPRGAPAMIDFLEKAFGAEVASRHASSDGVIRHATVRLGDSVVEMGEAHGKAQPMPAAIYLYVADVDAVYQQAVAAGGTSALVPTDQPYGDRNAWVQDPFGNTWYIATYKGS
jgi:PhnB protein